MWRSLVVYVGTRFWAGDGEFGMVLSGQEFFWFVLGVVGNGFFEVGTGGN